jgi:2-dehydro-3-deoxyphosphogluconate aldolase/(4S)-4-hydroxy-2-oxoglutarate aldolase
MSRDECVKQVLETGIVAIVRSHDSQQLVEVARALVDGGVTVIEITMTVPHALDVIKQVRHALGDRIMLGAGTILDTETGRAAILAGAEYLVSPVLNLDLIKMCRRYDKAIMPGVFSPTEIMAAWEAGAASGFYYDLDALTSLQATYQSLDIWLERRSEDLNLSGLLETAIEKTTGLEF